MTKTKKLTISAIIIALYVAVMYLTMSFSFGAIQVRVATSLYALTYLYPFLVLPLSLANMLSNILGGNILDIVGGFFAGFATAGAIYLARKIPHKLGAILIIPCIAILPALLVPIWLSIMLSMPYWVLFVSLLLGQIIPAILGYTMVLALSTRLFSQNLCFDKQKLTYNNNHLKSSKSDIANKNDKTKPIKKKEQNL